MRWGLKRYRSKGGNLRYVVLVGSSENNRELYYELTTQDWTGFRVKGISTLSRTRNFHRSVRTWESPRM